MRSRILLLSVSLAVSMVAAARPSIAQPPAPQGGPWAADADGDGHITREEMAAYMERRFSLMDQDGDGLVPAQTMQRLLGHEPQARAAGDPGGGPRKGRGGPAGSSNGGPPNGGPPPSGKGPGGDRADAGPPPGRAMPWPEDANDDGQIDRAEFLAPALALFADRDRNGDGVLSADELAPPPPPPGEDGPPPPPRD
ncbi:EF-hand domain-containing protein [Sphingobium sp. CAP-1]|uniref:EF-hand domain-containing protein n=1 Tax=Sphingobium sp. CAP-1 TaxID=2676077 RepID=UPI0012BB3AE1|nr:EF-hand domain-containing protein [Sphingobium sp. CAP-1]QGP79483.1 hypothetical protein GL174_11215 [Sphingobium sp. CAP-1]